MDTGSQRTYITKQFCKKVHAPIHQKESMIIGGFWGSTTQLKEYDVVKVTLAGDKFNDAVQKEAVVVEKVCSSVKGPRGVNIDMYPHLKGLSLAEADANKSQEIQILIGLDHYWDIVTGETIKGDLGPIATATKFGYILSGFYRNGSVEGSQALSTTVLRVHDYSKVDFDVQCKNFWELETIGIKEENDSEAFDIKIKKEEGKYHVSLTWKRDSEILGDNYNLAERSLALRRLQKDPLLCLEYKGIMEEQEKNGIIEEVRDNEGLVGKTYYMPHQAVIRNDKETSRV